MKFIEAPDRDLLTPLRSYIIQSLVRIAVASSEPSRWRRLSLSTSTRPFATRRVGSVSERSRRSSGLAKGMSHSQFLWHGTVRSLFMNRRLDLTAPTRYMGPRKLLKEGVLMKAKSGRKLRAFLCSDILVLTEETTKSLYRMVRLISSSLAHDLNRSPCSAPIPSRSGHSRHVGAYTRSVVQSRGPRP